MKLQVTAIAAMLLAFPLFSQNWTQKAPFTGPPRFAGEAFSIGNKGYIACGVNGNTSGTYYKDMWAYDPQTDSWTQESDIPGGARSGGVALADDTSVYIGLGWNGSNTFKDFYRYTPANSSWDTLAPYPGQGGRNSMCGLLGNKAYVGSGGYSFNGVVYSDFWEYSIDSNRWVQKGNLPISRAGAIFFTVDGVLYFGMGHDHTQDYDDLWAYNQTTDTWTQKASFPGLGRLQALYMTYGKNVVVGGGHRYSTGASSTLDDYYMYNTLTDTWSNIPNHFADSNRTVSIGFNVNGRAFMFGGSSAYPTALGDLWEFDITTSLAKNATKEAGIQIYPVPNQGHFFLEFPEATAEPSSLKLFNSAGKLLLEQVLSKGKRKHELNLSSLEAGIYLYLLSDERGTSYSGTLPIVK